MGWAARAELPTSLLWSIWQKSPQGHGLPKYLGKHIRHALEGQDCPHLLLKAQPWSCTQHPAPRPWNCTQHPAPGGEPSTQPLKWYSAPSTQLLKLYSAPNTMSLELHPAPSP